MDTKKQRADLDRARRDEDIDEASEESFPASDPPAFTARADPNELDPVVASTAQDRIPRPNVDSQPMRSLAPLMLAVMVLLIALGTVAAVYMP